MSLFDWFWFIRYSLADRISGGELRRQAKLYRIARGRFYCLLEVHEATLIEQAKRGWK